MVGQNLSFKLTIGIIALYFIEALIKAAWPAFPLVEAYTAEGAVVGAWFTKRAVTDTKGYKYGNCKSTASD